MNRAPCPLRPARYFIRGSPNPVGSVTLPSLPRLALAASHTSCRGPVGQNTYPEAGLVGMLRCARTRHHQRQQRPKQEEEEKEEEEDRLSGASLRVRSAHRILGGPPAEHQDPRRG
ncbi:hypothetical protein TREES_T100012355 [Tupaia chinensis]|uniref:Uncharacterized protein n=1 Tax=Tupaia chinensis TaxID=246437 RepID=L9JDR3_TUPCH|nr:hypothetical protein TREES_T100012355 [Tupaia chinensis]